MVLDMGYVMPMSDARKQRLEARRDALLARLRSTPNLMRGTVNERLRKCGRAACPCASGGPKHTGLQYTVRLDGVTHARYVRKGSLEQVEALVRAYNDLWEIIDELTRVNLDLVLHGENPGGAGSRGKRGRR